VGEFDFDDRPVPVLKHKSGMNPLVLIGGVIGIAVLAVGGLWLMSGKPAKLTLDDIDSPTVNENETFTVNLKSHAEGLAPADWSYGIVAGPPGARIDSTSGVFTWKPNEEQGPGEYPVTVAVQGKSSKSVHGKAAFTISVAEVNQPPIVTPIDEQSIVPGNEVRIVIKAKDADKPAQTLSYRLKLGPKDAKVDATSGQFSWQVPEYGVTGPQVIDIVVSDAKSDGAETPVRFTIIVQPPATPLLRLAALLRADGLTVENTVGEGLPGFTGKASYLQSATRY